MEENIGRSNLLQIQRETSTSSIESNENTYQMAPSSITNTPLSNTTSLPEYNLLPESYQQSLSDLTAREIASIEQAKLKGIQQVQFAVEDEDKRNRQTPTAEEESEEEPSLTTSPTLTTAPLEQLTPISLTADSEGDLGELVGITPHKYFFLL
jgi:hypothetical protein